MAYVELADKVGQGNQSFSETSSRTVSYTNGYELYVTCQFVASDVPGWRFKRWERRSRYTLNGYNPGSGMSDWSDWSQASTSATFTQEVSVRTVGYGNSGVSWDRPYDSQNNFEYRAVFEQGSSPPQQTYTVTVVADPVAGGTVTGGGQYQAGATCTITATPNSGYIFVKWTSSDGEVTTNNPHPFIVTKNITWTAKFHLCTNLLLHGSSNTLLHGSSGTLLHDA